MRARPWPGVRAPAVAVVLIALFPWPGSGSGWLARRWYRIYDRPAGAGSLDRSFLDGT